MNNKLEVFGRLFVIGFIALVMNITVWYQELPFQTFSNLNFKAVLISFFVVGSFIWAVSPIINLKKKQENKNGK